MKLLAMVNIQVNRSLIKKRAYLSNMGKDKLKIVIMIYNMQVNGEMECITVMDNIFMKMETYIQEISFKVINKVMVNIIIIMVNNIWACG